MVQELHCRADELLAGLWSRQLIFRNKFTKLVVFRCESDRRGRSSDFSVRHRCAALIFADGDEAFEVRSDCKVCSLQIFHRDFEHGRQLSDLVPRQRGATVFDVGYELHRALACLSDVEEAQATLEAMGTNQVTEGTKRTGVVRTTLGTATLHYCLY